jgi:hypothetical protein
MASLNRRSTWTYQIWRKLDQDAGQAPAAVVDAGEVGSFMWKMASGWNRYIWFLWTARMTSLGARSRWNRCPWRTSRFVVLGDAPQVGDVVGVRVVEQLDLVRVPDLDLELLLQVVVLARR